MKIATYNIDGLPETMDLNDLPWIFKPAVWIYKLFAGTTLIHLNDNTGRSEDTKKISKYLQQFDIVGVQEDFNYHNELKSDLQNKNWGTFQGAIDFSKIFSMVKWFRYKSDGLNIITNPKINILEEDIVEWKNSCGYFSHCNDKLTRKGFRRYLLEDTKTGCKFVVYVLHADASENLDDVRDSNTRRKQFTQLTDYIKNKGEHYPILIIGDTNCADTEMDNETISDYLMFPLEDGSTTIDQVLPNTDLDRVFVVNSPLYDSKIVVNSCEHGIEGLSDHRPFIVDFDIVKQ